MSNVSPKTPVWRKLLVVGVAGCILSVAWFLVFAVAGISATPTPGLSENAVVYVNPLCLVHNFTSECRSGMSYLGRETAFPTYVPYLLWASLVLVVLSLVMRRRKTA